jgi:hypothetical protein
MSCWVHCFRSPTPLTAGARLVPGGGGAQAPRLHPREQLAAGRGRSLGVPHGQDRRQPALQGVPHAATPARRQGAAAARDTVRASRNGALNRAGTHHHPQGRCLHRRSARALAAARTCCGSHLLLAARTCCPQLLLPLTTAAAAGGVLNALFVKSTRHQVVEAVHTLALRGVPASALLFRSAVLVAAMLDCSLQATRNVEDKVLECAAALCLRAQAGCSQQAQRPSVDLLVPCPCMRSQPLIRVVLRKSVTTRWSSAFGGTPPSSVC